ncbi:MAG: polysaccharide deacetylase family protein [Sporomusaceae bacterium]|jgi:peptidoglycan/xylan/chitin deacetylase (PgdA/CDA1 family)|nr:polysaccharide deacetylase family protein [Sporomusaceae bacterium]
MKLLRLFLPVIIFSAFFLWSSPAEASFQNGIPVLLYHHVSDEQTELPKLTVTTEVFASQMKELYQAGFQTISQADLIDYLAGKKIALPPKPIVISFDDGYEDNYVNAFPILKKYGFRATIFMVGVNIDAPRRLAKTQIQEMSQYGMEFGAHSVTHSNLTKLTPVELRREIRQSKAVLEKVVRKKVKLFSYPYGFFNLPVWEEVEFAGFEGAVTVLSGPVKENYDNLYLMRRITILRNTDFDDLLAKLKANKPKELLLDYWPELFYEAD